jgi:Aminoglycoside-2''-adenylyltransferase
MEDLTSRGEAEADREFFRIYGPWEPYSPRQVEAVMQDFARPWWIVGGQAIEAFTGVARAHEDIDISLFSADFPHLRRQLGDRFHLWSNDGGTFRFVSDEHPEPLSPLAQTWVREHAGAPWVMDFILNGVGDGLWQARRDLDLTAPLEDVTWTRDGVRYLDPEIVLFFKARRRRTKDQHDLDSCLPLLTTEQRRWLRDALVTAYGEHAWLAQLR